MNKKEVLGALEEIAVYLEIQGENAFRVSAYRKAAQALEKDERTLEELGDPAQLTGIGKGLGALIEDLRDHGSTELLDDLKKQIPEGLVPLLKLPGLGGKKVGRLYRELDIVNAEQLLEACEENRIQELSGFGKKSEEKIKEAVENMGKRPERLALPQVLEGAEAIGRLLDETPGTLRWELAGSFRRGRETVKDLDFILAVEDADSVQKHLLALDNIVEVIGSGTTKISLELSYGDVVLPVDFRLVEDRSFATTLHHFTGSKDHNVMMRQLAKDRGEKISEYGVEKESDGTMMYFDSEEAFYEHFGLPWIPPEQREGHDELETSYDSLIRVEDIRGDLHMHTTWSDGAQSLEEMVDRCLEKGYSMMAITDHSKYLRVANGLDEEKLKRQHEEIRRLEKEKEIRIFTGTEMDILPDATLDFSDDILETVDFVIASIHSSFQQDEEQIMKRLEAACRNPHVDMIAHPTGRILGKREGYKVNIDRLLDLAVETNTILELNANPNRLDLSADILEKARKKGVLTAINTDAHRFSMLEDMAAGVKTARRAGLDRENVINTWTAERLEEHLNGS
ncbi:DNA polymerase/3'-5' exonuclease PolX [Alkalicoccus urumqiensis]|uniref:DNA-directed DNA polymerase n=2 Tax=Alkalicoccus urumqiensis TaxID=1548213 RepID=A0A2P6MF74_ALKUR|nr:DNA polymerase/3'-5' exonuclease PolX [Alkalicoccus urumqiensis]